MLEVLEGEFEDYRIINNALQSDMHYKGYSLMELADLYEKHPEARDADPGSFSSMGMYKEIYELFKAHPELTLEEFKKKLPLEKLKQMQSGTRYKVLKLAGPIESKVEIYMAVFSEPFKIEVPVTEYRSR